MYPTLSDPREKRISRFGFRPELAAKILKAKRCFIVGMGPSISKIKSDAFKEDDLVIGVNKILKTDFFPDIVCVSDPQRLDLSNPEKIKKLIIVKHLAKERATQLRRVDPSLVYSDISVHFPLSKTWDDVDRLDPRLETIYWGGAVITDLAIPLAVYLGLKNIHVLGMDDVTRSWPMTHATGREAHLQPPDMSLVFHLHERIAYLAEKEGVTIRNASIGGFLYAFKRSNLHELLPSAIKRDFQSDISGRLIAFCGKAMKATKVDGSSNLYRFISSDGYIIRHSHGNVLADHLTDAFADSDDSLFHIEPSFVRDDWICLRSKNIKDKYVTSSGRPWSYRLRGLNAPFSPYFSSFRAYFTMDGVRQRIETNQMVAVAEDMMNFVGNMMSADDKR